MLILSNFFSHLRVRSSYRITTLACMLFKNDMTETLNNSVHTELKAIYHKVVHKQCMLDNRRNESSNTILIIQNIFRKWCWIYNKIVLVWTVPLISLCFVSIQIHHIMKSVRQNLKNMSHSRTRQAALFLLAKRRSLCHQRPFLIETKLKLNLKLKRKRRQLTITPTHHILDFSINSEADTFSIKGVVPWVSKNGGPRQILQSLFLMKYHD